MATDLIALLFALPREAMDVWRWLGPVQRIGGPCPVWRYPGGLLLITGMGAAATQRAVGWVLEKHAPRWVVSAGFCGGLVSEAEVGMVFQASEVVDETGRQFPLRRRTQFAPTTRLVSVATPVGDTESRVALAQKSGGSIVDMETATVAQCCEGTGVELVGLRVVTDSLTSQLPPDLTEVLNGERVQPLRLLLAVGRRVSLVADLWRLARNSRKAAHNLSVCLGRLLADVRHQGD